MRDIHFQTFEAKPPRGAFFRPPKDLVIFAFCFSRKANQPSQGLVAYCATRYDARVIKSFRHKGLRRFFELGSVAAIQPPHAKRLRMLLAALDTAHSIEDMNIPGFRLHRLKGANRGRWSVWVNGNWRLTFAFEGGHAYTVDYEDYH